MVFDPSLGGRLSEFTAFPCAAAAKASVGDEVKERWTGGKGDRGGEIVVRSSLRAAIVAKLSIFLLSFVIQTS